LFKNLYNYFTIYIKKIINKFKLKLYIFQITSKDKNNTFKNTVDKIYTKLTMISYLRGKLKYIYIHNQNIKYFDKIMNIIFIKTKLSIFYIQKLINNKYFL